ncbi:MAG: hydroxymethylbilane synthase [Planctomycetota bacterium]
MKIRVGTRGSELALTQTRAMCARIVEQVPGAEIEEVILTTKGDQDRETPLAAQGGVGVFTKELERALLDDEIDLAIHSLKDLPTLLPEGLALGAVPERASPWDAFISDRYPDLTDLPAGAKVATGSLRRRAQILHRCPHLEVIGIRGNIDTRLRRYREVGADALILAEAGLARTERTDVIRARFTVTEMTPAPGQGALGLEVRAADVDLIDALAEVDCPATRAAVTAERTFLRELEGGCHLPIGGYGRVVEDRLVLVGMLATEDGTERLQLSVEGAIAEARELGVSLTEKMRRAGGAAILESYREASDTPSGGDA